MADQLIGEPQRQIGQRADVDGDHAELIGAVQLDGVAEQAEAGIVDDVLDLDAVGGQRRGDLVAGIGLFEIAGNDDRRRAARATISLASAVRRSARRATSATRCPFEAKTRASSAPMPAEAPVISVTRSVTIRMLLK